MGWDSDEFQKQYDAMIGGMNGETTTFGMSAKQASVAESLGDVEKSKEVLDNLANENINGVKNSKAAVNRQSWEESGVSIDQIREIVEDESNGLTWADFGLNKSVGKMTDEEYKAVIDEVNAEPAEESEAEPEVKQEEPKTEPEEPKTETKKSDRSTQSTKAGTGSSGNVHKKAEPSQEMQDLYNEIFAPVTKSASRKSSTRRSRRRSGTTVMQQAAQIEKLYKAASRSTGKTAKKIASNLSSAISDISDTDISLYNELVTNHKKLMKKLKK